MYLNEKAWEEPQDDIYIINDAIKNFLDIYAAVKREYPSKEIYVSEDKQLYLKTINYSIEHWLSSADIEYRRLYLSFIQRKITYHPEDEFEVTFEKKSLEGGTEAYLNDSFMISICLNDKWKTNVVEGEL